MAVKRGVAGIDGAHLPILAAMVDIRQHFCAAARWVPDIPGKAGTDIVTDWTHIGFPLYMDGMCLLLTLLVHLQLLYYLSYT